jgi:hypothetical protein
MNRDTGARLRPTLGRRAGCRIDGAVVRSLADRLPSSCEDHASQTGACAPRPAVMGLCGTPPIRLRASSGVRVPLAAAC